MSETNERRPEGLARVLKPGRYALTITGPGGVILNMTTNLESRGQFDLLLDDEFLPELMVLNSMPQGIIESELHEAHKKGGAA